MTSSPAWDQAGSLPIHVDGRPRPEVAALAADRLPSVAELFTFMRDAELRFATLRMRIEEHTITARGEQIAESEVMLRHPGQARILTSEPGHSAGHYDIWITDGTTVRSYVASRRVGTERPVRPPVRGVADGEDLPGRSRFYVAVTPLQAESLPELFIHPGGYCQNVLATGACRIEGSALFRGRETILLACDHPRVVEVVADRPDFRIRLAVDRLDGTILRLEESVAGRVTRLAEAVVYEPGASLPPSAFEFSFPSDATRIY